MGTALLGPQEGNLLVETQIEAKGKAQKEAERGAAPKHWSKKEPGREKSRVILLRAFSFHSSGLPFYL